MSVRSLEAFENWGIFLSPHLPLVLKLLAGREKLSNLCDVEEPFTVSEAYELTKLLHERTAGKDGSLKFVNTGTIDPYVNLWGHKHATYIKSKYLKPVIDGTRLKKLFPRRFAQSTTPKILISGIRHFESFLDGSGEYVAGKSTVIFMGFKRGWIPKYLLSVLNSNLVKFFLKECHGSLAMEGESISPHITYLRFRSRMVRRRGRTKL